MHMPSLFDFHCSPFLAPALHHFWTPSPCSSSTGPCGPTSLVLCLLHAFVPLPLFFLAPSRPHLSICSHHAITSHSDFLIKLLVQPDFLDSHFRLQPALHVYGISFLFSPTRFLFMSVFLSLLCALKPFCHLLHSSHRFRAP